MTISQICQALFEETCQVLNNGAEKTLKVRIRSPQIVWKHHLEQTFSDLDEVKFSFGKDAPKNSRVRILLNEDFLESEYSEETDPEELHKDWKAYVRASKYFPTIIETLYFNERLFSDFLAVKLEDHPMWIPLLISEEIQELEELAKFLEKTPQVTIEEKRRLIDSIKAEKSDLKLPVREILTSAAEADYFLLNRLKKSESQITNQTLLKSATAFKDSVSLRKIFENEENHIDLLKSRKAKKIAPQMRRLAKELGIFEDALKDLKGPELANEAAKALEILEPLSKSLIKYAPILYQEAFALTPIVKEALQKILVVESDEVEKALDASIDNISLLVKSPKKEKAPNVLQ